MLNKLKINKWLDCLLENSKNKKNSLRLLLIENVRNNTCVSYRDIAIALEINEPPVISTVTQLLESLAEEDVKNKKPLLAVVAISKKGTLPAKGFFEKLINLGVTEIMNTNFNAIEWHSKELEKVKKYYV